MTRTLLAAAVVIVSGQAMAADPNGKCLLVVHGQTYIDGPCRIDHYQGSTMINTGEGKQPSPYFVYFNRTPDGGTEASWNAEPGVTHANDSLGEGFKKKGACWSNKLAKICTWPAK